MTSFAKESLLLRLLESPPASPRIELWLFLDGDKGKAEVAKTVRNGSSKWIAQVFLGFSPPQL